MVDFRALCIELTNRLTYWYAMIIVSGPDGGKLAHIKDLLDRANNALAEPKPSQPTDEQLVATYALGGGSHVGGLRAVLKRWGALQ
jgi:hypothetical protein